MASPRNRPEAGRKPRPGRGNRNKPSALHGGEPMPTTGDRTLPSNDKHKYTQNLLRWNPLEGVPAASLNIYFYLWATEQLSGHSSNTEITDILVVRNGNPAHWFHGDQQKGFISMMPHSDLKSAEAIVKGFSSEWLGVAALWLPSNASDSWRTFRNDELLAWATGKLQLDGGEDGIIVKLASSLPSLRIFEVCGAAAENEPSVCVPHAMHSQLSVPWTDLSAYGVGMLQVLWSPQFFRPVPSRLLSDGRLQPTDTRVRSTKIRSKLKTQCQQIAHQVAHVSPQHYKISEMTLLFGLRGNGDLILMGCKSISFRAPGKQSGMLAIREEALQKEYKHLKKLRGKKAQLQLLDDEIEDSPPTQALEDEEAVDPRMMAAVKTGSLMPHGGTGQNSVVAKEDLAEFSLALHCMKTRAPSKNWRALNKLYSEEAQNSAAANLFQHVMLAKSAKKLWAAIRAPGTSSHDSGQSKPRGLLNGSVHLPAIDLSSLQQVDARSKGTAETWERRKKSAMASSLPPISGRLADLPTEELSARAKERKDPKLKRNAQGTLTRVLYSQQLARQQLEQLNSLLESQERALPRALLPAGFNKTGTTHLRSSV